MGWWFRSSIKLAPGVRLNVGKRGFTSLSLGGRGATVNVGRRGVTTTLGIPSAGISYQHRSKLQASNAATLVRAAVVQRSAGVAGPAGSRGSPGTYAMVAIAAVVVYLVLRPAEEEAGQHRHAAARPATAGPTVTAPRRDDGLRPVPAAASAADGAPPTAGTGPGGLVTIAGAAAATAPVREAVTIRLANLRSTPSMAGTVLGQVPENTATRILQAEGNWLRVQLRDGGTAGWVHASLLR